MFKKVIENRYLSTRLPQWRNDIGVKCMWCVVLILQVLQHTPVYWRMANVLAIKIIVCKLLVQHIFKQSKPLISNPSFTIIKKNVIVFI